MYQAELMKEIAAANEKIRKLINQKLVDMKKIVLTNWMKIISHSQYEKNI
jgi:hypothetical protein